MGIKRVPTYFNEFACIGGACEDNCCIGWEVDIDDESLEVYKSVGGEFGDKLRRCMNDENSFTLKNNRCPFLNDKNLCDIFINIGEDKLCTVCTEYPRFTETYGSLTEKGLGMSCESAAEFIFKSDKPTGFETEKFDYEEECEEIGFEAPGEIKGNLVEGFSFTNEPVQFAHTAPNTKEKPKTPKKIPVNSCAIFICQSTIWQP